MDRDGTRPSRALGRCRPRGKFLHMKSLPRSPIMTVGFGGTAGIVASITCSPFRPWTLPRWSTTAQSAPALAQGVGVVDLARSRRFPYPPDGDRDGYRQAV